MKNYIATLALSALMTTPALAQTQEHPKGHDMPHTESHVRGEHMAGHGGAERSDQQASATIRQVEPSKVCMVNDAVFDADQIAVEVAGATYYGCCPMCKERLEKDVNLRKAIDPVSGNEVDKAKAVIGANAEGEVHYFESEENLHAHMAH